jgi:spore germination protein GerM
LEFSYYVPKLQLDRHITIRYREDLSCRRNPDTRRLIEHVGAGREIVGCLDLPETPRDGMTRVELWFGDSTDQSAIAPSLVVHRDIAATDAIAAGTVRAWIEGPTDEEKEAGAYPSAPQRSKLLGIDVHNGTAVLDLNEAFERTGLGTTYEGAILEQLAGTITQFDAVDRGLLKIEGEFQEGYMGHAFIVDEEHPLTRPAKKRYRVAARCGERPHSP